MWYTGTLTGQTIEVDWHFLWKKRIDHVRSRGRQVSHRRWIWWIHCAQASKHASEGSTLALKPRAEVTRSPKKGHQWPHIKGSRPTKIYKKKQQRQPRINIVTLFVKWNTGDMLYMLEIIEWNLKKIANLIVCARAWDSWLSSRDIKVLKGQTITCVLRVCDVQTETRLVMAVLFTCLGTKCYVITCVVLLTCPSLTCSPHR